MDIQEALSISNDGGEPQRRGAFSLWVPGRPVPYKRPQFHKGRGYPDPEHERYQQHIFACWVNVGQPTLRSKYWTAIVDATWARPNTHLLKDGSLSALGRRTEFPAYLDIDNLLKHIDVFVKAKAVTDDRYAVALWVSNKGWGERTGVSFAFSEV